MKFLKNNRGQVTVEYLLLAVALIALFHIAAVTLRDNESLKNFQEIPGQIFKDIVENGNWQPNDPQGYESRKRHPNHHDRHYVPDGKGPK